MGGWISLLGGISHLPLGVQAHANNSNHHVEWLLQAYPIGGIHPNWRRPLEWLEIKAGRCSRLEIPCGAMKTFGVKYWPTISTHPPTPDAAEQKPK